MESLPQVTLILLNLVVAPVCVKIMQWLKRTTHWPGTTMMYVAPIFCYAVGVGIALGTGLVSIGEAFSPFVLLGSGGVVASIASIVYNALEVPLGLSSSAIGKKK